MPVAVAGAALIVTLGAGAGVYVAPVVLAGALMLVWRTRRGFAEFGRELAARRIGAVARRVRQDGGVLAVIPLTAALVLPAWLTLSSYLHNNSVFTTSADQATAYGNLTRAAARDPALGDLARRGLPQLPAAAARRPCSTTC